MKKIIFATLFLISYTTIKAQCDLTLSVTPIPTNCANSCDGGIYFEFTNNGTDAAPYVAVVTNALGFTAATFTFFDENGSTTFENLCAGDYDIQIYGAFTPSCNYTTSTTITQPTELFITSTNIIHEDLGMSNGQITINASGGVGPYTYSINDGFSFQSSNVFSGLTAGIYEVVVMDDNGCTKEKFVSVGIIESFGCEVVADVEPIQTSCDQTCDGAISISFENLNLPSPGAPYNIIVTDSDGTVVANQNYASEMQTVVFNGLCSDLYDITIEGGTCLFYISTNLTSPNQIVIYSNLEQPTFNENNGFLELVVVGGTAPYSYSINNGTNFQSSEIFEDLAPGNYDIIVEDANGCQENTTLNLVDNTICTSSINANVLTNPGCIDNCNGSIAFNYLFNNLHGTYKVDLIQFNDVLQSQTFNDESVSSAFNNVCEGFYEITVTDGYGCTATTNITIGVIAPPLNANIVVTNANVNDDNGTATINPSGGSPNYEYSLNGAAFTPNNLFENLTAGLYIVDIMDNSGCIIAEAFAVNENNSCALSIAIDTDATSCAGSCDGQVLYLFDGPTSHAPYYSLLEKDGIVVSSNFHPASNVSHTIGSLCAGNYLLTVVNSLGCEQLVALTIPEATPIFINADAEFATVGINNGELEIYASGGTPPYLYSIDNQANWQLSPYFFSLFGGTYGIWVKDANDCIGYYEKELIDTATCPSINTLIITKPTCDITCDGKLYATFLDVNDNPPYTMELFSGGLLIDTTNSFNDFSGLNTFTDLCSGAYNLVVTDADGCTDKKNIYIHGPEKLLVTGVNIINTNAGQSNGSAEIFVTGGTAPYEFSINDGITWQDENLIENLDVGFYILMVQDANGCVYIHQFVINEIPVCNITTSFNFSQQITCHDSCDAEVNFSFFEAVNTPPYLVEIIYYVGPIETIFTSSNNYSGSIDSLCQGVYGLKVTNGNGCVAPIQTLVVILPEDLTLDGSIINASPNADDGSINLYASGGSGQHIYSLDDINYNETTFFDSLAPGIYQAYVQDENGCEDFLNFEILQDTACGIQVTGLADLILNCPGDCNGNISYNFSDVNSNPPYIVELTDAAGNLIAAQIEMANNESGIFSGLCAGNYFIAITSQSGCKVYSNVQEITQPDYIYGDIDIIQPTDGYYNGTITINPTGGTPPFEFSTNNQATWSTTNSWSSLNAGFYVIYVKDANGCIQVICVVLSDYDPALVSEITSDISLYPNPTSGLFFINAEHLESVLVYDLNGRLIETENLVGSNGTSVDLSKHESGIYIVEIRTIYAEVFRVKVVKN